MYERPASLLLGQMLSSFSLAAQSELCKCTNRQSKVNISLSICITQLCVNTCRGRPPFLIEHLKGLSNF
jgi:hypothetical protein